MDKNFITPIKNDLKQLNVCQVVPSINEHTGGPAFSVTSLAEALNNQEILSHIFTIDRQEFGEQVPAPGVKLHSFPATFLAKYFQGFHPNASFYLWQLAATELDIIHSHGLWTFPNLYARQSAVRNRLPLIISPRGMLDTWSLKRSRVKKFVAWHLYEKINLNSATIFHATSAEEANSIRHLGFQQPIALLPNGINIPNVNEQISREVLTRSLPELSDKKWLLFLSRIHPKKGLDNLLYVWQKLSKQFPDWQLLIAGSDLIGYKAKLELLIAELALEQRVTFTGMLTGKMKQAALRNADLFVLPTHSENFGMAVAESLASEVPVVTTRGTPWQDLSIYECGWWIEDNKESLAEALSEAMQLSAQKRKEMGLRGRNLVETKYSWQSIAQEMSSVYHWVVGGGDPPNCIIHLHDDWPTRCKNVY